MCRMKTVEQLLEAWENGTITPQEVEDLKLALSRPEARAQLANELHFYGVLRDAVKTAQLSPASPAAQPQPATVDAEEKAPEALHPAPGTQRDRPSSWLR